MKVFYWLDDFYRFKKLFMGCVAPCRQKGGLWKMFKRKLFKQALPIILSVAMTVQSMPATALAAENPAVEETVLDESTDTGSTSESTGNEQESDAQPAENADASDSGTDAPETANEVVSSSDAGQAASEVPSSTEEQSADKETATKASETETAGAEASKSETTETKASETETAATEASETETTGTKASETETAATEASETGVPVTETAASEIETEDAVEFAAENEEQTTLVAKIVVDDKEIDDWLVNNKTFWRELDNQNLSFFTIYGEESQYKMFQEKLSEAISIEVDGEKIEELKNNLKYSWVKKGETEGADTKLVDELPKDAGKYELTVSLEPEKVDGLYNKLEGDGLKVSLTIEKADVELNFKVGPEGETSSLLEGVTPGTTVEDLIEKINENYTIEYKKGNGYSVSRDILAEKKLPLSIFALDGSGKLPEEAMKPEDKFEQKKDYILKVGIIGLTKEAEKNYTLPNEKEEGSYLASYPIKVGKLQETKVEFTRKDAGKDLIEYYDKNKEWKIESVTEGIFVEEKDASGNVTKTGAPKVLIKDKNGEFNTVLKDTTPEAKWYTRIQIDSAEYKVDEEAGEIQTEENEINYVYKPMDSTPKEAGEYYIIWSYAGDDTTYKSSHSEAVRFTIDPVPAVIKIDTVEASEGKVNIKGTNFRDGMNDVDIKKELANISYGVYPFVKNAETGALDEGTSKIELTPEFFGTSYRGDAKEETLQYYVPEFILQRRVEKITEKGGTVPDFDKDILDWVEVTDSIDVVVEEEEEIEKLKDNNELPADVAAENLESVEFAYRIYFTGNKVLYDSNGDKIWWDEEEEDEVSSIIPITDVTTSAANKNYLVDIKKETLEKYAVSVPIEGMKTEEVQIVVDDIIDEFIKQNDEMLDPQVGKEASAEEKRAVHQGTLEKPAVKIYDQKALFTDRASYKKAAVHKVGEDGKAGEKISSVTSTDESLTYRWYHATLEEYEAYLDKYDEEQRKYTNFEEYVSEKPFDWTGETNPEDGTLDSFTRAGVYRLLVTYNDSEHMHKSAEAEVIFKVEQQEVIIIPTEQYAKDGEDISAWKNKLGSENKKDFTIYKLPHNNMEEFEKLTDDEKKAYELLTDDEIAAYEEKEGRKPSLKPNATWKVLRKVKNPETGVDTEEWVEVGSGEVFQQDDFTYGVAVNWTGSIDGLVSGSNNYTTQDVKVYKTTGEDKHHESVSAVKFYDQQIYVEVDADKIKALGHEYDGTVPDLAKVAEALTFYTDEALTEGSKINSSAIVNMTDEYDPAKINIYWEKDNATYANKNAVYGGTYTLMLRFEGGELNTKTADTPAAQDGDAAVPTYGPFDGDNKGYIGWMTPKDRANDDEEYEFTVTPRKITIKPKTISANSIIAGDKANNLLAEGIDEVKADENIKGILDNDQKFFGYSEIAAGSFAITWDGKNTDGTDKEGTAYPYRIDKDGGYPAFGDAAEYIIQVDGKDIKEPKGEYLRYGSKYTIKLNNTLESPLAESYSVQYETVEVEVKNRGTARIEDTKNNNLNAGGIKYDFDSNTYTIRPLGAVKFCYDNNRENTSVWVYSRDYKETATADTLLKDTNILGFRIYVPQEFLNDFDENKKNIVYQNAVWNAGGYFLGSTDWQLKYDKRGSIAGYYIDVVFPLTKEDSKKSFNITWEEGYTETFTLADIVLEEDLTKAVAPKSIKFNGVTSKMAVGETQQLDLKITKAQLGDVINIRYRIKGIEETKNNYISLDPETGVVTALNAGKTATVIEAYPVYKDAKGDFVPVKDSKGREAKAASTKITVTDVTASAVKKVVAQDTSAKLYFTVPDNGYRREIYVVDVSRDSEYADRKKWKPAQFDKAIAEMKNGQWESAGFATKPIYSYDKNVDLEDSEVYDKKLKAYIKTIDGLETDHDYVVYVRNVSAARALDDGSVVALSTGGAVKSFKTTKSQVKELELDFTIKTGDEDKKNTVTHPVDKEGNVLVDKYTVELSAKKAQLNVYGYFSDKEGGNDAAEGKDRRKYSLIPTIKEERAALKKYQLPKLQFAVLDKPNATPFDPGVQQSKYASINNKGLISLKGVDLNGEKTVYIYVQDSLQGCSAIIELTITAKPATVTGKKAKMKVGQSIMLSDYLEYKDEKKKKIPNYRSCGVTITKEMIASAKNNGYEITDEGSNEEHNWKITAVSPNKTPFELKVTDYNADGKPMEPATIKLTSTQIDAVKGLKVTYVDDQYITINFTHASNKPADSDGYDDGKIYKYALEVKDARGNVVDKIILPDPKRVYNIDGVNAKELKSVQSWIQYDKTKVVSSGNSKIIKIQNNKRENRFNYYTGLKAKTKTFAYTYHNEKLVRLSSYTLSVTPLYENQKAAKAATVKTKTTNIPASYNNVDLKYKSDTEKLGGNKIYLTKVNNKVQKFDTNGLTSDKITTLGRVISGNTYTLRLGLDGPNANKVSKDRVSDKLTWKSSNKKVATVKANAGTYTATLKALNQGKTIISVTSKVTKKVIARWTVTVSAVKDGSSYGGDYEPTWDNGFYENILALHDPDYAGRLEVLSENVPLQIDNDGSTSIWISFTAPHYGEYTLHIDKFSGSFDGYYDSKDGDKIVDKSSSNGGVFLEANQKIYFKVTGIGSLTMTGTELARLTKSHTKETPLEVKKGYVSFTAWEDNVYTFWLNGSKVGITNSEGNKEYSIGIKAGTTEYIPVDSDNGKMYVTYPNLSAVVLTVGSKPTDKVTLDKDNQTQYISFTANVTGEYAFTYEYEEGEDVQVEIASADGKPLEEKDNEERAVSSNKKTDTYQLNEGDKVVITVKSEITDAAKKIPVSVTVSYLEPKNEVKIGEKRAIQKGTTEIVKFVVPTLETEKAQFKFAVAGEEDTKIEKYYDADFVQINGLEEGNRLTVPKEYNGHKIKAGDTIYIKVTAGAGEADDKDAKDAELTVTKVPVVVFTETVTSDKIENFTNGTEKWYTFTAPADGYYEFGVTVDKRAENDDTPTHDATLDIYSGLFKSGSGDKGNDIKTIILPMKIGEMVAVKLYSDEDVFVEKEDGTKEAVTSSVTVSANALNIQKLELDKEATVTEIPASSSEVRYYSFTATAEDNYTVTWQPTDANKDYSDIEYIEDLITEKKRSSKTELKVGQTLYIKVRNYSEKYPAKGTLLVTAENRNAETLTAGTPYHYNLEVKDGNSVEKVLKFTAAEEGNYAIATTVKPNDKSGEPYTQATLKYRNGSTVDQPYSGPIHFEKGETKYFTVSFTATVGSEVKETHGTITISSIAKPLSGETVDLSIAKGVTEEYIYVIPESGRYTFKAEYDKEKATVKWSETEAAKTVEDGNYYQKNTKLKVEVTGNAEDAKAAVKLYKPAKIDDSEALKAGENPVAVTVEETKYYKLNTVDPVSYSIEISEIAAGKAGVTVSYAKNNDNTWYSIADGGFLPLAKNDKLTIKLEANSEKKDAECKLTLTANTELKLGDNAVHLEPGESANLTYHAKETGYYNFRVDQPGAELVQKVGATTIVGDSFCETKELKVKDTDTYDYTLTNEGSKAVDLTVKVKVVEPITVEPGKAEKASIAAGETAYFALKTFKDAQYSIKITDTSKGADLVVGSLTDKDNNLVTPNLIADGKSFEAKLKGEKVISITNNGIKATEITVELAVSEAQPLTDAPITLAKKESKKISFVATADDRYCITKDNENVEMKLVSISPITPNVSDQEIGGIKVNETVASYKEVVLKKGDKIVFELSYEAKVEDKKTEATQTVNVKITPVAPASVELALNKGEATIIPPDITIDEKNVGKAVWYQLTAKDAATYKFSLKDAYGNDKTTVLKTNEDGIPQKINAFEFYTYTREIVETTTTTTEKYMNKDEKVFMKVMCPEAGKYTLEYKAVETVKVEGFGTLNFEYPGEVQEVKVPIEHAGIYKISATSIKGNFDVKAEISGQGTILENKNTSFTVEPSKPTSEKTRFLQQDNLVTITVTADSSNKSKASVTLCMEEVNVATPLTLNSEASGLSDKTKEIYYELRIPEEALYAITTSGAPKIKYSLDGGNEVSVDGTICKEFAKDARIIVKVDKDSNEPKAYTIKVEKVNAISLDSNSKPEDAKEISEANNQYFGFTTANAYITYEIPANKAYYYAIEQAVGEKGIQLDDGKLIQYNKVDVQDGTTTLPDTKGILEAQSEKRKVTFTFENSKPKDDKKPDQEYGVAMFKFTFREVAAAPVAIKLNEQKTGLIAVGETVSYEYKATEKGTYIVSFNGSNCELEGDIKDGAEQPLDKDAVLKLTIKNTSSNKAGSYDLTVTKLAPTALTLGETAESTLEKGKTAYYEFNSTETTDDGETKYLVYASSTAQVGITVKKTDAKGNETELVNNDADKTFISKEFSLKKGEKLSLTLKNADSTNAGCKLTVKKVDYTPVDADTLISGTLKAREKAYYEFTATDASANGVEYKFTNDSLDEEITPVEDIKVQRSGDTGKLPDATSIAKNTDDIYTLKKGDKLQFTVANKQNKSSEFKVTVETAEKAVTYNAITLNKTENGKLGKDEKAGYEFIASEADKKGTLYSVYFSTDALSGMNCSYEQTRVVKGEDGKESETKITNSSLEKAGSIEFTCQQNDKIRFTVSGTAKYELTVKKVEYTELTLGKKVTKTLKPNETVYYQYTSDVTDEKSTEKYHVVYGNSVSECKAEIIKAADNTVVQPSADVKKEYSLEKGQILRFKLTNETTDSNPKEFNLMVKKVAYESMALDTPVQGRLVAGEYAYYQFIPTETPEEGKTITYHVYGTASYTVSKGAVKENKITGATPIEKASEYSLSKDEGLQFTVTGSVSKDDAYDLIIVKQVEKPFTVGKTDTGKLACGQKVIYALTYTVEEPVVYTISWPTSQNATITATHTVKDSNPKTVDNGKKISISKGDKLTVEVQVWNNDLTADGIDNVEFTVSEPAELELGRLTEIKKISAGETAYYGYEVEADGNYIVSMPKSNTNSVSLAWEVTKADKSEGAKGTTDNSIVEFDGLKKGDVLLFSVSMPEKVSDYCNIKLMLQKEPKKEDMPASTENTLDPGEIKYFKFEVPEADKKDNPKYIVSITGNGVQYKFADDNKDWKKLSTTSPYFGETSNDFVLKMVNTSINSTVNCKVEVQKEEPLQLGSYSGELEPYEYKYFVFPSAYVDVKDEKTGTVKHEFRPYYRSISSKSTCSISHSSEMFTEDNTYVVTVSNSTKKTCSYAFELRDAWKDEIKAAVPNPKSYDLEQNEDAYFTVTAPADKALYVSVNSKDYDNVDVRYGTERDKINNSLSLETSYEIKAGETCYFKVENKRDDSSTSFTLNVTESITLQSDTLSKVYIPSGGVASYEFEALEAGNYRVVVSGNIQDADPLYKYVKGTEEESFESGQLFKLAANSKLSLRITNQSDEENSSRYCAMRIIREFDSNVVQAGFGSNTGTLKPKEVKYFKFPGTKMDDKGNSIKFAPYYRSILENNSYTIEWRNSNYEWSKLYSSMCSDSSDYESPYMVRISNNTDKTCSYSFELRDAWKDTIKGEFHNSYDLEQYEEAYFTVTAPVGEVLYVSVSSEDYLEVYRTSVIGENYGYIGIGTSYEIAAGETCYFRVKNDDEYTGSFILNVTKGSQTIQSNTKSNILIPFGEVASYIFEAPEDGSYVVIVSGDIQNASYTYKYVDGVEKGTFENYQKFNLAESSTFLLNIENKDNYGSGTAYCQVEIVNITEINLYNSKSIQFNTYGNVYYLAVPVSEAGQYTIKGQVEKESNADFNVKCINNNQQMNVYGSESVKSRTVDMEANQTIYIKVWPYFADDNAPTTPYNESITITVTKN